MRYLMIRLSSEFGTRILLMIVGPTVDLGPVPPEGAFQDQESLPRLKESSKPLCKRLSVQTPNGSFHD